MAIDAAGRTPANAMSQYDGSFVLANVPRGELRFAARPYDVVSPKTLQVTEARHDVTLEVESLGTIVGTVVREKQLVPGALLYMPPNLRHAVKATTQFSMLLTLSKPELLPLK